MTLDIYIWESKDGPKLITGETREVAYRKAVNHLISKGATLTEAVGQLARESIEQSKFLLNDPYEGDLPDEVEAAQAMIATHTIHEPPDFDGVWQGGGQPS